MKSRIECAHTVRWWLYKKGRDFFTIYWKLLLTHRSYFKNWKSFYYGKSLRMMNYDILHSVDALRLSSSFQPWWFKCNCSFQFIHGKLVLSKGGKKLFFDEIWSWIFSSLNFIAMYFYWMENGACIAGNSRKCYRKFKTFRENCSFAVELSWLNQHLFTGYGICEKYFS